VNINIKFILMSIIVLGLIVNTSSFSDLVFADKPEREGKQDAKAERETVRADAKAERETVRADAKAERETVRADAKAERENVEEFEDSVIVTSSSTTTICHIPPGNPSNAHEISIGVPAVNAHLAHGDRLGSCDSDAGFNGNTDENESNGDDNNENIIENLTRQIANLEKSLQNFLDQLI
jgi:hypothetical protein